MALSPGARIGPYAIVEPLGAGGMGEVYRAHDTKLNRDVALKVLPESVANDPDRLMRFEREARALAALNHPHIAHIHGFEDTGSTRALVMELVEGEDLSTIISAGPEGPALRKSGAPGLTSGAPGLQARGIPIDVALRLARQIAEALEYAHEHGIIHRDLKPANIKVTPDGNVKVLDFGLAKALDAAPATDQANAQTMTSPAMTQMGLILGTAAYMSPEQAKGRSVDKRADIWAFGCVLYKMLTGRRAFAGDDVTDLIASVMLKEPDWSALPTDTPPLVRRLLARCVMKDPKQRLHDIGDARLELEEVLTRGANGTDDATTASPSRTDTTRRATLAWALAAAVLSALATASLFLSGAWPRGGVTNPRPLRVSIVHTQGREVGAPAISPDGTRVAYAARNVDGMPALWVRDLATGQTTALVQGEDIARPFWSPDSKTIAFFVGAVPCVLKRVEAGGGPVQVIAPTPACQGGTWSTDGTILFARNNGDIAKISKAGDVSAVTRVPREDWSHYHPSFLPDGRHFLFTTKIWTSAADASVQGIYVGSTDSADTQRLLPDLSSAVYAPPGFIVFVRGGNLTAAPFDVASLRVTGDPFPIGGAVAMDNMTYFAGLSAANDGTIAMHPQPDMGLVGPFTNAPLSVLTAVSRATGLRHLIGPPQFYAGVMDVHPDRQSVAAAVIDAKTSTQDLARIDVATGRQESLTATREYSGQPLWSPDGGRVAFAYQPQGTLDDTYVLDVRSGARSPIVQSKNVIEQPVAWSHTGDTLLIWVRTSDVWSLARWSFATHTLTPFVPAHALYRAAFSPDDQFVAFTDGEAGANVYVTTFPDRRQTWQVTHDGGMVVSWRRDGKELLVATRAGHIVGYPVSTTGGTFTAGSPVDVVRDVGYDGRYAAATPDHETIFIRVNPDANKDRSELQLLFGWQSAAKGGKK